eukprot:c18435_g1_i2 orf=73-1227(+)
MRCVSMALRCGKSHFLSGFRTQYSHGNKVVRASSLAWREAFRNKIHRNFMLLEYHKHHKSENHRDLTCSTDAALQLALHKRQIVPASPPPRADEIASLYHFVQSSHKLVVVTGAGISTESGIPDYRSPNGAYSTGFKPITHQEFVRSERSQKRYWARSYAGWRSFMSAQPGATHTAIAKLKSRGYIENIITQNVDRLHHRAGSNAFELHGSTHEVICLNCSDITSRHEFQDRVKELNPEWALALESLENGKAVLSSGMQQRPDGDIEIDESFWEGKFQIPTCQVCGGILKPNVVLFGDNLPKSRAESALSIISKADAVLVLGSSLMVLSAFRLAKAAHERGIPLGIVNVGSTRADELASLKIECRTGEILSKVLHHGCLDMPAP